MPFDKATALAQIDAVFKRRKELEQNWFPESVIEVTTLTCAAIDRLAPSGSAYIDQKEMAFKGHFRPSGRTPEEDTEFRLLGVLRALRADYEADRLQRFREMIRGEMFSDFLEMAEYFLQEGYKDAAAVIGGGVLEEHLRNLSHKHGVALAARPKLDTMNAELAKQNAYGKNDQKQVTAWADIRNDAAHAKYENYTDAQAKLMVAGIRDFIARNPA